MLFGCCELFEDDTFTFQRANYEGDEIKTNGYYYMYVEKLDSYNIIVFYRNGIVHNRFAVKSLANYEDQLYSGSYYKNDFISCWGLFLINKNELSIENIDYKGGLHGIAYTTLGNILNDSTICLYNIKESESNLCEEIDETYYFRSFHTKPDSTNKWIPNSN
jgi:hypothetical protein